MDQKVSKSRKAKRQKSPKRQDIFHKIHKIQDPKIQRKKVKIHKIKIHKIQNPQDSKENNSKVLKYLKENNYLLKYKTAINYIFEKK